MNQQLESRLTYGGWPVVGASLVGLAVSPGPLVFGSLGILAGAFQSEFGWGRGDVMFALTVFNLSTIVAAPFIGRLMDQIGARRVLIIFVSLFGASLATPYFGLSSLFHLYAVLFVAGAFSPGAQSMPYTRLITSWFDRRRGLAIGLAASGLGAGYAVIPPLVDHVLTQYGWRATFGALGASVFAIPLIFVLLLARPKPTSQGVLESTSLPGKTAREAIQTRDFWVIASTILLFSCLLTGFVPHIVPLLKDEGLTGAVAAKYAAAFGATTFLGRVVVGLLLDRFFAPTVAIVFFSISLVGFVLLLGAAAPGALLIAVLLVGVGFGAESDLIAYFVSRYFGLKSFGQIYGYMLSAFIIGAAIGPIALGYGYDYFGRYTEVLVTFVGVGLLGLLALTRLGPYPFPASSD
ncbi:MAG: MFS transporter [Pseudomonadota bacterium]